METKQIEMMDSVSNAPKRLTCIQLIAAPTVGSRFIGESRLSEIVQSLRTDTSDVVRHEAAFLLGQLQIEDRLEEPLKVLGALVHALKNDKSILVVHEVALSLANFPCEEVIEELLFVSRKWAASEVTSSVQYAITDMLNKRGEGKK